MKKSIKIVSIISLVAVVSASLIISRRILSGANADTGNKTVLTFYGWGNASEVAMTRQFVDDYNQSQDKIFIKYTSIPNSDYQTKITNSLYSRTPPDIFLAGDGERRRRLGVDAHR